MAQSPTLLGIADAPISVENLTWNVNKIGGKPDWMFAGMTSPNCEACHQMMRLCCQLYCPLHESPYHRTLYIFACVNSSCWNKPQGWRVLRCQYLDKATTPPPQTFGPGVWDVPEWGDDEEMHVSAEADIPMTTEEVSGAMACPAVSQLPLDLVAAIPETPNKFLPVTVPSGAVTQNISYQARHTNNGNLSSLAKDASSACKENDFSASVAAVASSSSRHAVSSILPDLIQMTINDMEVSDVGSHDEGPGSAVVQAEDLNLNEKTVENMQRILAFKNEEDSEIATVKELGELSLTSFYLNVFDEPSGSETHDELYDHAREAQLKYEQEHGASYREATNPRSFEGTGEEKYEKIAPHHGNLTQHKFLSCVQKYPRLCIRYNWLGKPLWIDRLSSPSLSTRCHYCGEACAFELQLMPAIINFLKFPGSSDPAVEFGTVLIFSCSASCWTSESGAKEEIVIVQADPDQHFFKI